MKKRIGILLLTTMILVSQSACSQDANETGTGSGTKFDFGKEIQVVSREDGSGTRSAFIELFEIEEKFDDGSQTDRTTQEAVIAKQTDVMMTNITGNVYAIGYISLGSLNDTVKALQINGVTASSENVKNGSYLINRPFNIATPSEISDLASDFIDFILSEEGQKVVADNYIPVEDGAPAYAGNMPSGTIVVAGSSSVTPVMEKLKEAYLAINTGASIEIQQSDSSAGMTGAIDGTCDIGMASRELKDTELEKLTQTRIALDGIAVIVNNDSPVSDLSKEQVRAIFIGDIENWSDFEG